MFAWQPRASRAGLRRGHAARLRGARLPPALLATVLIGAGACAVPGVAVQRGGIAAAAAPRPVAVAPTQFLAEWEGVAQGEPAFRRGLVVGDIFFSGGWVRTPPPEALIRSRKVDVRDGDAVRARVARLVHRLLVRGLAARGLAPRPAPEVDLSAVPVPVRRVDLARPGSGDDNENAPPFRLRPADRLTRRPAGLPAGARALLVPIVVYAYTHNAGWFLGQRWGCRAGARLRVLWLLYDLDTLTLRAHADVSARYIAPDTYQPDLPTRLRIFARAASRLARGLDESLR